MDLWLRQCSAIIDRFVTKDRFIAVQGGTDSYA